MGPGRRTGEGRAAALLRRESERGSSLTTSPTGGSRLAVRERKGRREGRRVGHWAGDGGKAGWAGQ
jgi:hypothetical protein